MLGILKFGYQASVFATNYMCYAKRFRSLTLNLCNISILSMYIDYINRKKNIFYEHVAYVMYFIDKTILWKV